MSFFDEMFADSETTRLCYRKYYSWLNSPEQKNIVKRKDEAENVFRRTGITFNVYSENGIVFLLQGLVNLKLYSLMF